MSANVENSDLPLREILKPTGFYPPKALRDKTFREATSGGGVSLEDNAEKTINVKSYTEPVEITPAEGKDGMKKATVTLSDIPQLESNRSATIDVTGYSAPVEITPTAGKDGMEKTTVALSNIPQLENDKAQTIDVSTYSAAVEVTPSQNKDAMKKATISLSNIPQLENNKPATIDVSTYSGAVEVTPSSGKDAMKKTTVSLSNIPQLENSKTESTSVNGAVVVNPTSGYDGMKQVTVNVNIPLEDNKAQTIDVSSYSSAVEITPTAGKTAMKKTTVTLSNIPSGGGIDVSSPITLKLWKLEPPKGDDSLVYLPFDVAPQEITEDINFMIAELNIDAYFSEFHVNLQKLVYSGGAYYTRISDTEFTIGLSVYTLAVASSYELVKHNPFPPEED